MINEQNRQTGRTFRMLLKALTRTSELNDGQVIIVVTHQMAEAEFLSEKAAGLMSSFTHSDAYSYSARYKQLKIVGGGCLVFTSVDALTGIQSGFDANPDLNVAEVIKDHYVLEKEAVKNNTLVFKPAPLLEFFDCAPEVKQHIGKLEIKDGLLFFEGNADKSAKVFFNEVMKPLVDKHAKNIAQSVVDDISNSCMFEWDDDRWHEGQGYLGDIQDMVDKKYGK